MKQLIAVLLICCALNACKEEKKEKKFDEETYEKSKESLADKEKNNPARFLKVDNRDRRNLLGQTVLIGHLENTATVCTYKDVELRLSFFSKTGVQLDEYGRKIEEDEENLEEGENGDERRESSQNRGSSNNKKNYTSIQSYKPSGNLIYDDELLNKIENKFSK